MIAQSCKLSGASIGTSSTVIGLIDLAANPGDSSHPFTLDTSNDDVTVGEDMWVMISVHLQIVNGGSTSTMYSSLYVDTGSGFTAVQSASNYAALSRLDGGMAYHCIVEAMSGDVFRVEALTDAGTCDVVGIVSFWRVPWASTGVGILSNDTEYQLNFPNLTENQTPNQADYIAFYDDTAKAMRRVDIGDLLAVNNATTTAITALVAAGAPPETAAGLQDYVKNNIENGSLSGSVVADAITILETYRDDTTGNSGTLSQKGRNSVTRALVRLGWYQDQETYSQ